MRKLVFATLVSTFRSPAKAVLGSVVLGLATANAALPPGWKDADIGTPALAGSADYNNGVWVVTGNGAEVCSSDQLHFVWTRVNSDATLIAKVENVGLGQYAQAGLMFRNDVTNRAVEVAVLATPTNGVSFQWRADPSQSCSMQILPAVSSPVWLRLCRSGTSISAWYGNDGVNWFQVGTTSVVTTLSPGMLGGLAVCSQDAAALASATFSGVTMPPPVFGAYREKWTNLNAAAGNSLAALTNTSWNPNWPDNPDPLSTAFFSELETETDTSASYYGQRLKAFVVPPQDGSYEFSIASDDTSELLLSTDETPSQARRIAWVRTSTAVREWTKETNQVSTAVPLQAGVRYYMESRMQQGTGNDNLAIRWRLPSGSFEEPIPALGVSGTRLVPFGATDAAPGIFIQPTNQLVGDGVDAMFAVLVTNQGPVTYRWQLNGSDIQGTNASQPVYFVRRASGANQGQVYRCAVSNNLGYVISSSAVLSVLVDTNPPLISAVFYLNPTNVSLYFSEPLEVTSATNTSNYVFTNAVAVSKASLSTDGRSVTLTTTALQLGTNYSILVRNLRDRAVDPNSIAPNTFAVFLAAPYVPGGVGNPLPAGSLAFAAGGYDVAGAGRDIAGTSDQFQYNYELRNGDFDISTRLDALGASDPAAKAGLMVRQDLTPGSRYAAVLATPTFRGISFQYRAATNGTTASVGMVPVNYPQTWLRLRRAGDLCTGYASYDGTVWQLLGSTTLPLTDPVYFGLAICSRSNNTLATARFRNISDVINALTGTLATRNDIFGPSSRRTGITVTEIMYHPAERADGRRLEFIELFNTLPWFEDLSGYEISGDIAYTFPQGTTIGAGAYLVVAAAPDDVKTVYGINNVLGPYTNNLSNNAGTVRLRNKIRAILLEVNYDTQPPWPTEADGGGHSLVLSRPSYGEGDPRAWSGSDMKGGSPGSTDGFGPEPCRGVVINEILAHTDPPLFDGLELFNSNLQEVDLSGCYLTDDPSTNKYRLPPNTRIPGRSFLAFNETQLGFRLDAGGETVYLVNSNDTRVLNAVRFEAQANAVSSGRYPDGAAQFRPLASRTLGSSNSPLLPATVVINEIMYYPMNLENDDQYVELYNNAAQPISLGGWKFTSGIKYTFPSNAFITAKGYVVVSRNVARMFTNYPALNPAIVFGDFGGALAHSGEKLVLSMPEDLVTTNTSGTITTNTVYVPVSEVTYGTGGRWGQWAHGGGSSLELTDSRSDTTMAANWADSDETTKAPWSTVEYTGKLDNGSGSYSPDQLQLFMMGEGECLVDAVEVFRPGETNRITNPNFNNGATGWYFQGTHRLSGVDTSGGYGGGACLHVRASGRGDTGANRIRTVLSSVLPTATNATIRAKVRWLKGDPEILLRLHGNWLEAAGRFSIPANLGTPGARNSRFVANAPPAIADVTHTPALPAANQDVVVTARVADPDGVGPVVLRYRNDTSPGGTLSVNMLDDGTAADQFPNDGIYSAVLPGRPAGTLLAFYIQASDAAVTPATSTFPSDAPARECLVRFGDTFVPGVFGNYRIWITAATASRWSSRERNSNEPLDATFVYGNFRPVYNMRALYSGSPFHTGSYSGPTGSACDYVLSFPDDDKLLGVNDYVIATLGNLNNDNTYQREQAAFWVLRELGVPSLYRRYVVMFVNGVRRGTVLEDAQQPSSELVDEYFPDDNDGFLHKIEDWFEFDNSGSSFANVDATLDSFTTTGGQKKVARYRWNWRPRAVKGSSNNFTNLLNLVDAVHVPLSDLYTTAVNSQANVEEWMRVFALERFVGNWDSYSYDRGKNMYAYKPLDGPWHLMAWDIDFVWDLGGRGTTSSLFGGQDRWVDQMRSHPPFRRAYWRAFQDMLDGPLQDSRINPMLDTKYAGLVGNGVSGGSPSGIKSYISGRRSYVQQQLNTVAAAFNVISNTVRDNLGEITGTAPVKVKTILFNGNEYPVTWTSVTNWKATVPLQAGSNPISIVGLNSYGQAVPGSSNFLTLIYQGSATSPVGQVVINEIMAAPKVPDAEYVELFNSSSNLTFDLSGWEFHGLSYTFPGGVTIGPRKYLVLAKNIAAFTSTYGSGIPVSGAYAGSLQADGETLSLVRPGPIAGTDLVIDKVRYRNSAPWPQDALDTGASLQLIDDRQDNWRAGNWTVASTNPPVPEPQWVYATAIGAATSTPRLYIYLQSAGDIYIDDMQLVAGSVPGSGPNLLVNGDFESSLTGTWNLTANFTQSVTSTAKKHSGNSSLHVIATAAGGGLNNAIWQDAALTSGQTYAVSFWYLQSTNGGPLTVRLSGSGLTTGAITVAPPGQPPVAAPATPGATNSVAQVLPAFPPLYINEVQAQNLTGITNRAGQRTPWLELFNPSTNSVSLDELYLANQYSNLTAWTFPAGTTLKPGGFKVVFADGRTDLSTTNEPHANFTLAPAAGSIALSRLYNSKPQVLDYLEYTNLLANQSFGSAPDAQGFDRQAFFYVTPGASNNAASAPLPVVINEWMASNTNTLRDPVTGKFEDWFELYNYSTNAVDLAGYYLTDTLTNQSKFRIPAGYAIPPKGFLLVWADNKNTNGTPDLHVTWKMNKDGESLGLYGADGRPIDYVNYGLQIPNTSEGRYPDGSFSSFVMPVPTPGTNNVVPNSVPRLNQIADKVLLLGQTLRFTATASDADLPPQVLTFNLGPNRPAGAYIDPTGVFLWTPSIAPSTNRISVVVTDNGVPPLSATNFFTAVTLPPPQLSQVELNGDGISFTVVTLQGQLYQLEYCDDLALGTWFAAGPAIPGTGAPIVLSHEMQFGDQRFYRLRITQ